MKKPIIEIVIMMSMIGGSSVPVLAKASDNGHKDILNQIKTYIQNLEGNTCNIYEDNSNLNWCNDNEFDCSNVEDNQETDIEEDNNSGNDEEEVDGNNTEDLEEEENNIIEDNDLVNTSPNTDDNIRQEDNVNIPEIQENEEDFIVKVEELIYKKVNEERVKNGLLELSYNTEMEKYARMKSKDMGENNYFSHEDLNGKLITEKMKLDGVSYKAWGENIAYISGVNDANKLAEQFMTNWMNSSGHRANILSTNFESIGIGIYNSGNKVYATQEFYR